MRCKEMEEWTFSELVGAFLDLAITYLLLSASALEFLASRFLSLFGLSLPCPCNGLLGDPNGKKCWRRVLSESPPKTVSSVQLVVLNRPPFATVCSKISDSESYLSAVNDTSLENDVVGFNGKSPGNSFSEKKSNGVEDGVMDRMDVKERRFDFKGKRVRSQKARYHRRLQKGAAERGRSSSASSDVCATALSPASAAKMVNKSYKDGGESSLDSVFPGSDSESFVSNEPFDENDTTRVDELTEADLKYNEQRECCIGDDGKNAIRVLEHELEQEHAARSALYLELEKERSAAASAADEAMAMIMRLQEEKASIEMEARQYQRMIEEKSAYDFEEMRILQEILIRREKEKHFLVKEVEAYRKIIFQNEQLDYDAQDVGTMNGERNSASLYTGQDSSVLLQRFHESIYYQNGRADNTTEFSVCDVRSAKSQNCTIAFEKELPIPESNEVDFSQQVCIDSQTSIDKLREHLNCWVDISQEFQEKKLITLHKNPHDLVKEMTSSEPVSSLNIGENDKIDASNELQQKPSVISDQSKTSFAYNSDVSEKHEKSSRSAMSGASPCIHDIPVPSEVGEKRSETHSMIAGSDITRTCNGTKILETKKDISRSYSDINRGSPPTGHSRTKFLVSDLRRNSMSVVDFERSKIDDEVGCLRERLRIVQEGRERLNISPRFREKNQVQSQLLDNIVSQLREIRQLTEPRKLVHLASLPLPPSKGVLKKRNWRSVSLAVHGSS